MATVQESVVVQASPERVWDAVVDFEGRAEWSPRVKWAYTVGGGLLQEGSQIRILVGRRPITPTVIEMQPPLALTLLVRGPGFRATHAYAIHQNAETTTITLTGSYSGLLGGLFSRLMRGSFRKDLTDELEAIKRAAEV